MYFPLNPGPMPQEYTCAMCGETYQHDWTNDEAEAEYAERFPDAAAAGADRAVICGDCDKILTSQ